jgi:hypothetical protein
MDFSAALRPLSFTRRPAPTAEPAPIGCHFRHAGLGVWCSKRGLTPDEWKALRQWKQDPAGHEPVCRSMASDLAALIGAWQPAIRPGWVVTTPPAGASAGRPYAAGFLGRAVAQRLDLDYQTTLAREGDKRWHGRHYARQQRPFLVTCAPSGITLVVDDLMTTGSTMRLALDALRQAGTPAYGFAWLGND